MQNLDEQFPVESYNPEMERQTIPWLVRGLWQRGKINGVAGYEKSGKSRLLGWVIVGLHQGKVLGLDVVGITAPRILYLCGEETKETVNERITKYAELQGVDNKLFRIDFMDAASLQLELKPRREWLLQKLLDGEYDILVMDPLRRLHGANEDKSTEMAPILNDIRKWSNRQGLTVILLHHTGKIGDETDMDRIASWFRGSTDLAAIVDTATYVQRTSSRTISIRRQGRFEPVPNLLLNDLGDEVGFTRKD